MAVVRYLPVKDFRDSPPPRSEPPVRAARPTEQARKLEYVIEEPAPKWLNAAFALHAMSQNEPRAPEGGYERALRLRPGVAFDVQA